MPTLSRNCGARHGFLNTPVCDFGWRAARFQSSRRRRQGLDAGGRDAPERPLADVHLQSLPICEGAFSPAGWGATSPNSGAIMAFILAIMSKRPTDFAEDSFGNMKAGAPEIRLSASPRCLMRRSSGGKPTVAVCAGLRAASCDSAFRRLGIPRRSTGIAQDYGPEGVRRDCSRREGNSASPARPCRSRSQHGLPRSSEGKTWT